MNAHHPTTEKRLFTPGPLTTSPTVKRAMLHDLGSRDHAFIATVQQIRQSLLDIAGVADQDYAAILMQGSGTFGIESVIGSVTPPDGAWLIIINGAYGRRMAQIAETLRIPYLPLTCPEDQPPSVAALELVLAQNAHITHVAAVHCETTTGIVNPIRAIGHAVQRSGRIYFVDAMSSFGAIPLDMAEAEIDYLVSSANKCIEGVPGFSFVLARRSDLLRTKGWARSLSLDLFAQWQGLEQTGQFRFTPPTHALLAFAQALEELADEGGINARAARYAGNYATLIHGMRALGFREYLAPDHQSYIITSFRYPDHPNFDFDTFYARLNERGFVIYPGKVSDADCFRIGTIGQIREADVSALLTAIADVAEEMQISA